jgi:predicted helicase
MVRSVDELLKSTLHISHGLADEHVVILDPATGTGTFLCSIVRQVHRTITHTITHTMQATGEAWRSYVDEKLLPRLFGFELLMAPYTIAHLNLAVLLRNLNAPLNDNQHPNIALASALSDPSLIADIPGFERLNSTMQAAQQTPETHSDPPVLVVIGNPPYSNFGTHNKSAWIQMLLEPYKQGLNERKINLDDDFIRFIRFGQWSIEQAGQGILAFITSHTYLEGLTHRRMRQSLTETFTDIYILDLHGSSLKHEICPDGSKDENVFDIRQGVSIGLFVRQAGPKRAARVHHAEMWGKRAQKYDHLATTTLSTTNWTELHPCAPCFFFVPHNVSLQAEYETYHNLKSIYSLHQGAIKTDRDGLFFDMNAQTLEERMRTFYAPAGLAADFRTRYRIENTSSYALLTRRQQTMFDAAHIRRCLYRPFDVRWLYYNPDGFTSRPAYPVMRHMQAGPNIALLACRQQATPGFHHVLCTDTIAESHAVSLKTREGCFVFPLYRYPAVQEDVKRGSCAAEERSHNFAPAFITAVSRATGLSPLDDGAGDGHTTFGPEDLFHYLYAVLHSPTYRTRYADLLKIDFPHIPLPPDSDTFRTLATCGAALADLHLLRIPEPDFSAGTATASMGKVGGAGGAAVLHTPADQGIIPHSVTAGTVEQVRYDARQGRVLLARGCFFAGVEPETWAMQVGGYQPLERWLKERKGRTLTDDDALHYMRVVVALRETRRLMAAIDEAIAAWPVG